MKASKKQIKRSSHWQECSILFKLKKMWKKMLEKHH